MSLELLERNKIYLPAAGEELSPIVTPNQEITRLLKQLKMNCSCSYLPMRNRPNIIDQNIESKSVLLEK